MPLYYVDVVLGERICRDPEGVELPDEGAARDFVREDARDLLRHMAPAEWASCELVVFDDGRKHLFSVSLFEVMPSEAQRIRTGNGPAG